MKRQAAPLKDDHTQQILALGIVKTCLTEGKVPDQNAPYFPHIPWPDLTPQECQHLLDSTLNQAGVESPFSIQRPDGDGDALLLLPTLLSLIATQAMPAPLQRLQWLTDGLCQMGRFQYLDPHTREKLESTLLMWFAEMAHKDTQNSLNPATEALQNYASLWNADFARQIDHTALKATPFPILYTREQRLDLRDFGIMVPLMGSRPQRILTDLINHFGPPSTFADSVENSCLNAKDLTRVHGEKYVQTLLGDDPTPAIVDAYELIDENGVPNRYEPETASRAFPELVNRALIEATGTFLACEAALKGGFCHFLGGGMHHAMHSEGRGFCLINDIVIAIKRLQAQERVTSVWVIDIDCHKGDGTAALTSSDDTIHTLSIHMAQGWPLVGHKFEEDGTLKAPFIPSTVDVPMPVGKESDYLKRLNWGLKELQYLAGGGVPDLAIVVGGSDVSELDILKSAEGIRLSLEQTLERDKGVYSFLASQNIPQAWVMAGGYGPDVWQVHAQFLRWVLGRRQLSPTGFSQPDNH